MIMQYLRHNYRRHLHKSTLGQRDRQESAEWQFCSQAKANKHKQKPEEVAGQQEAAAAGCRVHLPHTHAASLSWELALFKCCAWSTDAGLI